MAILAAVFAAAVAYYWDGIGPGDAERYLRAALLWQDGAWLGDTHWALRHFFVLPMAAGFAVFGPSEATALLPNLVYAALTVALTFLAGSRFLGARAALIAAALIATSAFFVARPLELDVYGAEVFFAALAMWIFLVASESTAHRGSRLFAAGLTAGLASTIREHSVYLLAVFGALVWFGRGKPFTAIALVVAGFAAVIAAELVLYSIAAGDPFYRYKIDLDHRAVSLAAPLAPESSTIAGRIVRAAAAMSTTPATAFMLMAAIAGVAYLCVSGATLSASASRALFAFAVVAVVSAAVTPLAFNIASTGYYPLLTYAAFLFVAMAIAELWSRRKAAAIVVIMAVVVANAAATDVLRDGQYSEARFLAARVESLTEPVYSDGLTVSRVRYQLLLRGWPAERASFAVRNVRDLPPNGLYFWTKNAAGKNPGGCALETHQLRRSGWTHLLLRESGIARLFGPGVEARVAPPPKALFVRAPGEGSRTAECAAPRP